MLLELGRRVLEVLLNLLLRSIFLIYGSKILVVVFSVLFVFIVNIFFGCGGYVLFGIV